MDVCFFRRLIFLLSLATCEQLVKADYDFRVAVHAYRNPEHCIRNHGCCEHYIAKCGWCSWACDNYFVFCLDGPDKSSWGRGSVIHTGHVGGDVLDFTPGDKSVIGQYQPNPLVFTQSAPWTGYFNLTVYIYDKDDTFPATLNGDEFVDVVKVRSNLSLGRGFTHPQVYQGVYRVVTMNLSFLITCAQNFSGHDCMSLGKANGDEEGEGNVEEGEGGEGDVGVREGDVGVGEGDDQEGDDENNAEVDQQVRGSGESRAVIGGATAAAVAAVILAGSIVALVTIICCCKLRMNREADSLQNPLLGPAPRDNPNYMPTAVGTHVRPAFSNSIASDTSTLFEVTNPLLEESMDEMEVNVENPLYTCVPPPEDQTSYTSDSVKYETIDHESRLIVPLAVDSPTGSVRSAKYDYVRTGGIVRVQAEVHDDVHYYSTPYEETSDIPS